MYDFKPISNKLYLYNFSLLQFAFRSVKLYVLTHILYFLQANTVAPRQLEALLTPILHGLDHYISKSYHESTRGKSDIESTNHFCRLHRG